MNKELLETPIVKASLKRYSEQGLSNEEILNKLEDIHFIFISEEELREVLDNVTEK